VRATPELVRDLDTVAAFLALDDLSALDAAALRRAAGVEAVDCLVLVGNAVLHTAERAFEAFAAGLARRLVITGGVGHSTAFLRQALASHPRYCAVDAPGLSEAELLATLAIAHFGIDAAALLLETRSTNCGENAVLTRALLEASGPPPRTLLLVQDPTMQRRTDASFRRAYQGAPAPLLLNHPTFVPRLVLQGGVARLDRPERAGLWPVERLAALVMGEVPRLRDDAQGYGPRGRGFITHVEIPAEVEAAHARLLRTLPPRPAIP
jgi:uncharacterized SAM-binding protein YcdF (DUF218 family)